MSDERPVEELIGWVRRPIGWGIPPSYLLIRRRAEVDDLAAWLDAHWWDEHEDDAEPAAIWRLVHDEADDGQMFWYVDPYDDDPDDDVHPTIRDALVAAVRRVSDVQN